MKNRYNIALLPLTVSDQVIQLADHIKFLADDYVLGKHSYPHVTIGQFMLEESRIEAIWQQVRHAVSTHQVDLIFKTVSCMVGNRHSWVSLLPDACDTLITMHYIIGRLIRNPINKAFNDYEPHMTLINSINPVDQQVVEEHVKFALPIKDRFILTLGRSDSVGQYQDIIFQ